MSRSSGKVIKPEFQRGLKYFFIVLAFILLATLFYFINPSITGFVVYEENEFIGGTSGENITYNASGYALRFINVSEDANVTSATLILKGHSYQTNYSINYTPSSFSMSAGCSGTISLAPDATYAMTVCINNGSDVSGSCNTINSGEYTVGDDFIPNSAILTDGTYRLKVTWGRIKDPASQYDHGASTTSSTSHVCSGANYIWNGCLTCDCSGVATGANDDIIYNGNECDGGIARDYNEVTASGLETDSCRTYEGYTRTGGSSGSIGSCIGGSSRAWYPSMQCYSTNWAVSVKKCTAGTAPSCPSGLCSYAGSNTEYTGYVGLNDSASSGSVSVSFTESKITSTGFFNWSSIRNFSTNVRIYVDNTKVYENLTEFDSLTTIDLNNNSGLQLCIGSCTNKSGLYCNCQINFSTESEGILEFYNLNVTWKDIRAPRFSSNVTNETTTSPKFNETIQLNTTWTDGINVSTCIFGWNVSGIWSNESSVVTDGTNVTINFTGRTNATRKPNVGWRVYCNDSEGNLNESDIYTFKIRNTKPTFNHTISDQTVAANTEFTFDFNASDIDLDSLTFYVNDTRFLSINQTNGTLNGTPSSSFVGTHPINVSVDDGEENTSLTFNLEITDSINPQWSGNKTNANSSFPKYSEVIQINLTMTDNSALKNFTLTVDQNGVINNTNRTISGTSYQMIENVTVISPQGTVNKWNVTFYDAVGNVNRTDTFNFTTRDSSPQWSSNKTNANSSFPKFGDTMQINLTITNNVELYNYTITLDQAGFINVTNRTIAGTSYQIIENFTINSTQGISNIWNVTFYDKGNGSNSTSSFTFVTRNTQPSVTTFNVTNDTSVNFENKTYFIIGNGTFSDIDINNVIAGREIRWKNGSTIIPNENGYALDCSNYANTYCKVGENITAEMRVQDNSTELNNFSDWNVSTYLIIDTVYPRTFANITANNITDDDGDGNIEINWTDDPTQINETYRLYRYTSKINSSNIGSATLLKSGLSETTEFYEDTSAANGTTYWYALVTVNQDGFYNESILSLVFNATGNDTVRPIPPEKFNVTGSGATATLTWLSVTQDILGNNDSHGMQYMIYYGTNFNSSKGLANESITSASTKTLSTNATTITVTSSGTYHFVVTSLDDGANSNLSVILTGTNYGNVSLTVSSSSSDNSGSSGGSSGGGGGGGGGGSGGGGAGGVAVYKKVFVLLDFAKGTFSTIDLDEKNIAFTKVRFIPQIDQRSPVFMISNIQEKPSFLSTPKGISYQYLEIEIPRNTEPKDFTDVSINFRVDNDWMEENKIDKKTITLQRYKDFSTLEMLPTSQATKDANYTYFTGVSPGLSYFVITGNKTKTLLEKIFGTEEEEAEQLPEEQVPGEIIEKKPSIFSAIKDYFKNFSFKIHWQLLVLIISAVLIANVVVKGTAYLARKSKGVTTGKKEDSDKTRALEAEKRELERLHVKQKEERKQRKELEKKRKQEEKEKKIRQNRLEKQRRKQESENRSAELKRKIKSLLRKAGLFKSEAEKRKEELQKKSEQRKKAEELEKKAKEEEKSRRKQELEKRKESKKKIEGISFSFKNLVKKPKAAEKRLAEGKIYLVKEKGKDKSFSFFKKLTQSRKGLAVIRENPKTMPYKNANVKYVWLSTSRAENSVNPSDIEMLYEEILDFISSSKKGIVLLQGVDYLIRGTNFSTVINTMTNLKDEISDKENILLVSYNPTIFDKNQHDKIESEFEILNKGDEK